MAVLFGEPAAVLVGGRGGDALGMWRGPQNGRFQRFWPHLVESTGRMLSAYKSFMCKCAFNEQKRASVDFPKHTAATLWGALRKGCA